MLAAAWLCGGGTPASAWGPRPPREHDRGGVVYVGVAEAARAAGLRTERGGRVVTGGGHTLILSPEQRQARFDRQVVFLHEPALRAGRRWALARADWEGVIAPLFHPEVALRSRPAVRVMLDPGHGGVDRGAEGPAPTIEKHLTLEVCGRIRDALAAQGVAVEFTRTADTPMGLEARSRVAAERAADLFVSVHFNSAGNREAAGVETYVLSAPGFASTADANGSPHDPARYPGHAHAAGSMILAWHVHSGLCRASRAEDRGIRRARFAVLREAPCPAILVECGFLSNPAEEARIRLPAYRQGIADGIAAGIREYVRQAHLARSGAE